ncbi:E3 ubiquitin-protein ligase TRIM36-like [Mytilus californianus]|uniref:E3 ubiquitin-protein ligase TRIM36-like n=1 Tax=Mytilus californianus TaxID=6549 RepID=UPI002246F6E5|nr:E3 ubiquitin-protein ligase TRIM36-like [Mytilus californianus]
MADGEQQDIVLNHQETVADHLENNLYEQVTGRQQDDGAELQQFRTSSQNAESRNTQDPPEKNSEEPSETRDDGNTEQTRNPSVNENVEESKDSKLNGDINSKDNSPRTDGERSGTSLSRATTEVSLDLELNGPSHDQKEAQFLLVKCPLCSENMRMPKILPCLHSFCESCLETYVKKLIDRSKTTTITCPLCHAVVLVSRNRINAREYIESLPTSTLISTVLSKKAARTRLCNVCNSDLNKAVSWCGYCALAFCEEHVQYHKQLTSIKQRHPTVSLDDISGKSNTLMFPYQKCHFHKKEDLHLFCKEEWTPCCHVCRKMLHKICDNQKGSVVPLPIAAAKVKDSKHAKTLKKRLDALREEAEEISDDRIKNLDELELQLRLGRESISTIRQNINDHLDQLEDDLHDELTEIYERTRIDLEEERDKAEIKLRTVVHYQNLMENITIHSPDTQAITEMSQLRDQTKNVEGDIHTFKRKAKTFEISITTYAEYFKQINKMGSLQRREISAYKLAPVPPPIRSKTNLFKGTSLSKSTL